MNEPRQPFDPAALRNEPDEGFAEGDGPQVLEDTPKKRRFGNLRQRPSSGNFGTGSGGLSGGVGGFGGYGYGGGGKQVGQERTEEERERFVAITHAGKWLIKLVAVLAVVLVVLPLGVFTFLSIKSGEMQDTGVFGTFFGHLAQVIATIFSSSL